jgi:hypothetical protein
LKTLLNDRVVPEITAVSIPKRRPPRAATRVAFSSVTFMEIAYHLGRPGRGEGMTLALLDKVVPFAFKMQSKLML